MHAGGSALPCNGNQRCTVHIAIGNPGNEIGGARTQGGHADTGTSGEATIDISHKGSGLFVSCDDEFDGAVQQRIHYGDVFFSRNTKNIFHALMLQTFYEELGRPQFVRHLFPLIAEHRSRLDTGAIADFDDTGTNGSCKRWTSSLPHDHMIASRATAKPARQHCGFCISEHISH
jgi:hypothetical protein